MLYFQKCTVFGIVYCKNVDNYILLCIKPLATFIVRDNACVIIQLLTYVEVDMECY